MASFRRIAPPSPQPPPQLLTSPQVLTNRYSNTIIAQRKKSLTTEMHILYYDKRVVHHFWRNFFSVQLEIALSKQLSKVCTCTAGNPQQNSANTLTSTASTAASLGQLLSTVALNPDPLPAPISIPTSISHSITPSAELKLLLGHVTNPPNPTGHYYTTEPPTLTSLENPHPPADPVLLPRDTDPFSPTRKKSDPDPFQESDLFAKLDAFEFEAPPAVPAPSIPNLATETKANVFNGPLQVQLPPEKELQLQQPPSTVRNRPTASVSALPSGGALDVISSISNKKMPHLLARPDHLANLVRILVQVLTCAACRRAIR